MRPRGCRGADRARTIAARMADAGQWRGTGESYRNCARKNESQRAVELRVFIRLRIFRHRKSMQYYAADNTPTARQSQDARQLFRGESSMVLRPGIRSARPSCTPAACAAATTAPRTAAGDATAAQDAADPQAGETPRHLRDAKQVTQGSVTIMGRAFSYQAEAGVLVVHVKDPMDEEPAPMPREEKQGGASPSSAAGSEHVLCRVFSRRQARPAPSDHLPLQRRSRVIDDLAAPGCIRSEARGDGRRRA